MSTHPASHGLKYHARAIAAQADDGGASCWMAGTTVLTEENEVDGVPLYCCVRKSCNRLVVYNPKISADLSFQ